MPTETDLIRIARFRTGGYGAMVRDDDGAYVRVDDMRELLELLHSFALDDDKPLVRDLLRRLGDR